MYIWLINEIVTVLNHDILRNDINSLLTPIGKLNIQNKNLFQRINAAVQLLRLSGIHIVLGLAVQLLRFWEDIALAHHRPLLVEQKRRPYTCLHLFAFSSVMGEQVFVHVFALFRSHQFHRRILHIHEPAKLHTLLDVTNDPLILSDLIVL